MKKLRINIIACLLALVPMLIIAQEDDQVMKARGGKFALINAKIYTVTNGIIENGTLMISNGVIEAVGTNVTIPVDAEVIDVEGKGYPGMSMVAQHLVLPKLDQLQKQMTTESLESLRLKCRR